MTATPSRRPRSRGVTRRQEREARRLRSRRLRALLASGLVLGVGSAITLAAWNDAEHGRADFTAGRFGIVGAVGTGPFGEHPTSAAPAALAFQLPATAAAMAPGSTVYALFSVKTIAPSVKGGVRLTAGTPSGALAGSLRYGARVVPAGAACDAASYAAGTVVVADGSPLGTSAASTQPLLADGGSTVAYCFAVSLPSDVGNEVQGQPASQTWQFVGQST